MVLTSRPYCLPSTWPGSSVPGSMLVFSVFMSTALSIGKAAWRLTMSPTTPGWGMNAMSGVSLAWIFCMISWLMLSTFCHLTVIPSALASLVSTSFRPSCTGWSMLLQIVTVLLSPPLPPLPHAANDRRGGDRTHRKQRGPSSPWESHHLLLEREPVLGHVPDRGASVTGATC